MGATDLLIMDMSFAQYKELRADTLRLHNELRAKHNAAPLTWSAECAQFAQQQADQCQAQNTLAHGCMDGPSGRHGQNAYGGDGAVYGDPDVIAATQMFYDEIKDYDFGSAEFNMKTGHFTQLVWKATTSVGVGISGGYAVFNYFPAGNATGCFQDNVSPAAAPSQGGTEPSVQTNTLGEQAEYKTTSEGAPNEDPKAPVKKLEGDAPADVKAGSRQDKTKNSGAPAEGRQDQNCCADCVIS